MAKHCRELRNVNLVDRQSQLSPTYHPHDPHLFNRKVVLQILVGHLVLSDVQQSAVIQGSHQGLVVLLKEGEPSQVAVA